MFAAVPDDVAAELGVAMLELVDSLAVRVRFLSGSSEVNHAVGISTAEQLDRLAGFYGETRHAVSPRPEVDLDATLRERGYEPGYAWIKFSRDVDDPPPASSTDLEIVEVAEDGGADFGRAAVEGYGMPRRFAEWLACLPGRDGWHCFVAYDGSEPAAGGAVHVFEDVGWLGLGATRPEFRRRGAQSAILAARIRRAAELGCRLVVTETGARRRQTVQLLPEHLARRLRTAVPPCQLRPRPEGRRSRRGQPCEDDRLQPSRLNRRILGGEPPRLLR